MSQRPSGCGRARTKAGTNDLPRLASRLVSGMAALPRRSLGALDRGPVWRAVGRVVSPRPLLAGTCRRSMSADLRRPPHAAMPRHAAVRGLPWPEAVMCSRRSANRDGRHMTGPSKREHAMMLAEMADREQHAGRAAAMLAGARALVIEAALDAVDRQRTSPVLVLERRQSDMKSTR